MMPSLNVSYKPSRVGGATGVDVPVPMLIMVVHQPWIMALPIEIAGKIAPKGEHILSLIQRS